MARRRDVAEPVCTHPTPAHPPGVAALTNHPASYSLSSPQQISFGGGHLGTRRASYETATARRSRQWTPSDSELRCHGTEWGQQWAGCDACGFAGRGDRRDQRFQLEEAAQGQSWYVDGASAVCMHSPRPLADHRTCSCSLCVLSTICKSPMGLFYSRGCSGRMRLCVMFGMS